MTILRDSSQKRINIYIDKYKAFFLEPDEVQNPKPLQNDQDDQFKVKLIGELRNYLLDAMRSSNPPVITTTFNGRKIFLPILYVME